MPPRWARRRRGRRRDRASLIRFSCGFLAVWILGHQVPWRPWPTSALDLVQVHATGDRLEGRISSWPRVDLDAREGDEHALLLDEALAALDEHALGGDAHRLWL